MHCITSDHLHAPHLYAPHLHAPAVFEYYRLAAYLLRYTSKMIGIREGVPSLRDLFDEKYYKHLEGGILQIFSRDGLLKTREGDVGWERMVPPQVAQQIKGRQSFGCLEEALAQ